MGSTLQEIRAEIECYNRNHGIVQPAKKVVPKKKNRVVDNDDNRYYNEELDSMGWLGW
ncbi:hypothetical protein AGMMS49965_26050 [Bacteroidia bacterium]|nr:hypothetical protein AGMMS49965_26050 [Bacteroidia bacterium]